MGKTMDDSFPHLGNFTIFHSVPIQPGHEDQNPFGTDLCEPAGRDLICACYILLMVNL